MGVWCWSSPGMGRIPASKVKEQELSTVVTAYLDGKGLLPENGYIVDASFVEVPRQRNTRVENASIKEC